MSPLGDVIYMIRLWKNAFDGRVWEFPILKIKTKRIIIVATSILRSYYLANQPIYYTWDQFITAGLNLFYLFLFTIAIVLLRDISFTFRQSKSRGNSVASKRFGTLRSERGEPRYNYVPTKCELPFKSCTA